MKAEVSEWRVRGWRVHTSILLEEVTVRHEYRDGNGPDGTPIPIETSSLFVRLCRFLEVW